MGMPTIDSDISMMETEELERIEDNNKKFLYARAVHANHMVQHHMHEIFEHQRVVDKYRSMADGEREMIPLESNQYKNDPLINQHIMGMINTDIFWYGKTFRAILMELWKTQNGETIAQSSEELSNKDTHYCDESHTTFNDQRLYNGEKTQQGNEVMASFSEKSKTQKDWPRKCFQMDENETYKSAMMCWDSLDNSEQASKKRKTSGQDTEPNDDKEMQVDEMDGEKHVKCTVDTGN